MRSLPYSIVARGVLGALVLLASARAGADELPRYKLKVGQQLTYRCESPTRESDHPKGGKTSSRGVRDWTAWVVRENADGGWGLIFRDAATHTYSYNRKQRTSFHAHVGQLDLKPDGQTPKGVLAEDSLGSIFPPLPPDRASLNSNWTATRTIDGGQRTLSTAEPGATTPNRLWTFDEDVKGAFDAIYLTHEHSQYQFDGREGIVRTATTTTDADWPKPGYHSTSTIELTSLVKLEPEKLAAVAADAEKFFAMRHQYMQLLAQASGDNARCEGFLDQAKSLLNESESQITASEVRPLLVDMKDEHALSARLILQAVTEKAPLVDKPSAEWKTVDMAGQPHALADYRGKVVVLDFWFRGCRPCIASMPQMKRLVDDFRGQDVAILGINSDDKDEDAQFVIDKLGLNYSTLKNSYGEERINVKYKVHGWPTLVIIDAKGIVRHFHTGSSLQMSEQVGSKIRALLAENKP